MTSVLGIEYIGNELRAAVVSTETGELKSSEFVSLPITDHVPSKFMSKIHELVQLFDWKGSIGLGFPGPVNNGIILQPPFLASVWEFTDLQLMLKELTDLDVYVTNASDATAWAEMNFGAGRDLQGMTIVLSIGPIISSSIVYNKLVLPNSNLGLLEQSGQKATESASNTARKEEGLKRKTWAKRIQSVLSHYEDVFNPDAFILCGEICHKADKVIPFIDIKTEIKEAELFKYAGLIGAACLSSKAQKQ